MAKKPPRIRRTFTPQFKKDAVALVRGGRSVNEVAHDLGIARSLLQRWRTQLAASTLSGALSRHRPAAPAGRADPAAPAAAARGHRGARHPKKSLGLLRGRPEVKFHFIAAHRAEFRRAEPLPGARASRPAASTPGRGARRPRQAERNDALLVHIRAAYQRQPADLRGAAHSPGAPGPGHPVRPPSRRPAHAPRGDRRLHRAALPLDRDRPGRAAGRARSPPARLHGRRPPIALGLGHHLGPDRPGLAPPGHRARSLLPPHRRLGHGADPRPGSWRARRSPWRWPSAGPPPGSSSTPIAAASTSRAAVQQLLDRARARRQHQPAGRAASTTPWPRASSTRSRPNWSTSTATARARRRAWRSSSTSRPSTTAPAGTRASAIAHPRSTKPQYAVALTPCPLFWGKISRLQFLRRLFTEV